MQYHATFVTFHVYSVSHQQSMNTQLTNTDPDLLLDRCRKKEGNAYKKLYEQYSSAMFSISMRIVNNRDEAEDILQESFLKAFKDMSRFNNRAAFGSWLKRVVINHSLDVVRNQKLNFISIEDATDIETEDREEEIQYDITTVTECINQLPQGYRVILTLFLMEEYSHKEISEMLGISEGTSKSQYNRARKKLATLITQKTFSHEQHA